MFHLIAPQQKKSLLAEYRVRLLFIISLLLLFLIFSAVILLLPSYYFAMIEESEIISEQNLLNQTKIQNNTADFEVSLADLKENLELLGGSEPSVSGVIENISNITQGGIQVRKISYAYSPGGDSALTISGMSSSRPALVAYSKKLEEVAEFKKVELPISNLAKNTNIEFVINVSGNF